MIPPIDAMFHAIDVDYPLNVDLFTLLQTMEVEKTRIKYDKKHLSSDQPNLQPGIITFLKNPLTPGIVSNFFVCFFCFRV